MPKASAPNTIKKLAPEAAKPLYEVKRLSTAEFVQAMIDHNRNQPGGINPEPIYGVIVYKPENFDEPLTTMERSYLVGSNSPCFRVGVPKESAAMRACFGDCLDGRDLGVRIDYYNWKEEYRYIWQDREQARLLDSYYLESAKEEELIRQAKKAEAEREKAIKAKEEASKPQPQPEQPRPQSAAPKAKRSKVAKPVDPKDLMQAVAQSFPKEYRGYYDASKESEAIRHAMTKAVLEFCATCDKIDAAALIAAKAEIAEAIATARSEAAKAPAKAAKPEAKPAEAKPAAKAKPEPAPKAAKAEPPKTEPKAKAKAPAKTKQGKAPAKPQTTKTAKPAPKGKGKR